MQRPLAVLLILVSAFLLFWRLDGSAIWRDEGTTAVWGRLMVDQGALVPWVYDFDKQQLLVQAPDGHDVNSKLLPAMQSYLQFYVAALSFFLFGVSEWTARAPFALLGALTLWLFYRLGRTLYPGSAWALAPPLLMATSLMFLHAARQCRYYVLVILGCTWLLLELAHYLKEPERADRRSFYLKLAGAGFLLYFSNYVSFVCTWGSVGLFAFARRDWRLIRGFCALSAVMAAVILPEFFLLHAEFAGSFPPPLPQPLWDIYQTTFAYRGSELWRTAPWFLVFPVALWAFRREGALSRPALALGGLGLLMLALPIWVDSDRIAAFSRGLFAVWAMASFAVVAALALPWLRVREKSLAMWLGLPAMLILVLSPLITIGAGRDKATTRHYYQILPPAILFAAMAAATLGRRRPATGVAALAVMTVWPTFNVEFGGTDEVVPRQFTNDRSYNGPLIQFLETNVRPGEKVAFHRNVKGMAMYFYFPEIRWVGLLDSTAPHNQKFRGRIPDDQFDDAPEADWFVLWDTRGEPARSLDTAAYDKVWEYAYPNFRWGWTRHDEAFVRRYEVYRRR
ncbi:MAG: hypothetical protein GC160_00670 [Acidobacteria bacterium]|nr:hypothetical protein [Acidobacteriota bacterium]